MGAPKRPGNLQIQQTICKWYLPDGESSLKAQNTNLPSAQTRNQNDLTADFADSTDKKAEPIRAIGVIRGQKHLRGARKLLERVSKIVAAEVTRLIFAVRKAYSRGNLSLVPSAATLKPNFQTRSQG